MTHFELLVIGSGPAGEKGAAQAAYFGKRVALVEKNPVLGGAKIHNCALPSKGLRETARLRGDVGRARFSDLMCRREPVVSEEIARVRRNLADHRITLLRGAAHFLSPHTLDVDGRRVSADVILIATGSSPRRPAGVPFEHPRVHDTTSFLTLDDLPTSLLVVGGGVIGCELASMLARLGTRVDIIDRADRLLPFADVEVSRALAESFAREGIRVRHGASALAVLPDGGAVTTLLADGSHIVAEHVLFAVGRDGNTAGLNLAAAGLTADAHGRIAVDANYCTAVPHIYAAGDVIGFPMLASTSMEQARVAMCHAFDFRYKTDVSPILPLGINTIPELAMVGHTEQTASAADLDVEVGRAFYRDSPRAQLLGDPDGVLKLVFHRGTRKLLGAHIVGERATDLIHIATTAMQLGGTIDTFIDAVYNYPTLSELYKYAAYDGLGRLRSSSATRAA